MEVWRGDQAPCDAPTARAVGASHGA